MTLGERIQTHRKQCALSQEKLAETVGVSRQAVTKWEADQSVPSMENLIKLSEIFSVPLDQLANGNAAELEMEANQPDKRDNTILMVNLTILATIFICTASNGYYQGVYANNETPWLVWLGIAFIGGISFMFRDRLYYQKYRRLLLGYDLIFIIPIFAIPLLPIRFMISVAIMIVYAVTFMMVFIHKKIRPWKLKRR